MTWLNRIKADLAVGEIGKTAWGIPKVSLDNSLFHGMFTYNIPVTTWYEKLNDVVLPSFTNCLSVDGALIIQGANTNDSVLLQSYRNPRYEPNRGFLYSTAAIIDTPGASQTRRFGVATKESGVFFSLENGILYGVIRTTRSGVTSEDKFDLDITGVDLSKGNVFDIQYQWRGVGNYKFFVNLVEVGNSEYLGTLTELSMYNPACPIFFENINLGDSFPMKFGCVDVTSEGGKDNGKTYGSVSLSGDSSQSIMSSVNTPIIAVRSKLTVGGLINTRDTLALLASAYADNKAIFKVWITRDFSAITDGDSAWEDFGDGHLEFTERPEAGGTMSFDKSKAGGRPAFACRVSQDATYATSALFEGRTSIYLTPGDMFVFTLHRENANQTLKGGVTFEFSEEI